MPSENHVKRDADDLAEGNGNEERLQHRLHGNGVASPPQYHQPIAPPMHPLAPPRKKVKGNQFDDATSKRHLQHAASPKYPYPPVNISSPSPSTAPSMSQACPAPPASKHSARERPNSSLENPYSTSRGLRHFSMKVCEKVEEKGTTTYNEVADELVRELMQAEEAIQKTATANGDGLAEKSSKKSSSGKQKRNHDDKNIRRRVYDALNVLMAMDIITKNRKEITWRGLPGSKVKDHLGDGSGIGSGKRKVNGLSRRQRVQQLQVEVKKRQEDVGKKVEFLQELMIQNVCFQNLLGRNYARDFEDSRRMTQNQSGQCAKAHKVEENEKIPLPFIIVNTDSTAIVQCEMCPRRTNVNFDFSLPFEINDDNEILKRLGMSRTSKEALQRSLPPEIYRYCNARGLLQTVAQS